MNTSQSQLRKAAILISALDHQSADALLEQMGQEQAALVRDAVIELGAVDAAEQQEIVAEFMSRGAPADSQEDDDGGVELEISDAAQYNERRIASAGEAPSQAQPRFQFLQGASSAVLIERLRVEHPQTTAVVLAHLPAARAAEVLGGFDDTYQADVLRRIATQHMADPQAVQDLEDGLATAFAGQILDEDAELQGLEALNAILSAARNEGRDAMVANLANCDRRLVSRLGYMAVAPPADLRSASLPTAEAPLAAKSDDVSWMDDALPPEPATDEANEFEASPATTTENAAPFDFAELSQCNDQTLAQVFQASDRDTLLLALAGADEAFVRRLLRSLSTRDAKKFRRQIQKLGPLLLSDIERAQAAIAASAGGIIQRESAYAAEPPRLGAVA